MDAERLSKRERQDLILNEIRTSASIRISRLAKRLGVTGETIRRDLAELGEAGLVSRTYGGATIAPFTAEPSIAERDMAFVEERARIGRAAAEGVESGEIVMIDGGSTTYQVARSLVELRRNLVVITNSARIAAAAAANPSFRVIVCPGVYDVREGCILGEDTVEFVQRYNAHLAVIGASNLSQEGPSEAVAGAAAVKRAMIRRAGRAMLVMSRDKFARPAALERVCGLESIDELVCDGAPPAALARALAAAGTRIRLA